MDIEIIKKLIIGKWDKFSTLNSYGSIYDQYVFTEENETRNTSSHLTHCYSNQSYFIENRQEEMFLIGKTQRELYAISEKCMVWKGDNGLEIFLRII